MEPQWITAIFAAIGSTAAVLVFGFGLYHRRIDRLPVAEITQLDPLPNNQLRVGYKLRPRDGGAWIVQGALVPRPKGAVVISARSTEVPPEGAERTGESGIVIALPPGASGVLKIALIAASKSRIDRPRRTTMSAKLTIVRQSAAARTAK